MMVEIEKELRSSLTTTVETAAKALGLSRPAAYAAVRTGEIPAIRIGRRWSVPTAKLLELVGRAA